MPEYIFNLIKQEAKRQADQLSLIASENYVSKNVLEASGSILSNKYAEGYPGKRYYAGNDLIDQIEEYTISQAKLLFSTDYHLNVQPYSGSPANLAAYTALLKPGETILAMSLAHGGHLTHGHPVSLTGSLYNFVHYGVDKDTELIDYVEVLNLAKQARPKLIVCGASAYSMFLDFSAFAKIAQEVGAWLMVDMAHTAGLIAAKAYPNPFGLADLITSSTQKTLRGPRGGLIFCRPELARAVDKAVFPGLQGGPHLQTIAAKAVCFEEAQKPAFTIYIKQVILNAKTLAYHLQQRGLRLVADGTETHLFLLDLRSLPISGLLAQNLLENIGLITNRNSIPYDPEPPTNPSGLRLGTAAITSRGMKEPEMEIIADCIMQVLSTARTNPNFNQVQALASQEITSLAKKFRIPTFY